MTVRACGAKMFILIAAVSEGLRSYGGKMLENLGMI